MISKVNNVQWVIRHLESELRREKMFGSKHGKLVGDPKYKASADFSKQRIPQLEEALTVLKGHDSIKAMQLKYVPLEQTKKVKPTTTISPNQLELWPKRN